MENAEKIETVRRAIQLFLSNGDICDFYDIMDDIKELNGYNIAQYYERYEPLFRLSADKMETSIVLDIPLMEQLENISSELDKYTELVEKIEQGIENVRNMMVRSSELTEKQLIDAIRIISLYDFTENEIRDFKKSIISFAVNSGSEEEANMFRKEYCGTYKKYFAFNLGNVQQTNYVMNTDMLLGAAFFVFNKNVLESFDRDIWTFGKTFKEKLDIDTMVLTGMLKNLGLEKEYIILENIEVL